jgi:hypothetical protein
MPQELQIIRAAEFIRMGAQGHFDLAASKAALAELARACHKRGINQAMMDLRALHPGPKPVFTPADLAALVSTFKEIGFTHQQRLAVLYGSDPHRRARLFAFLSTMHGWSVRAFGDFEEALLWLSGTQEAKARRKRSLGAKEVPVQFLQRAQTARPHRLRAAVMVALLPVALVALASCASKKSAPLDRTVRTEQQESGGSGFGSQTYSTSVTTTSTVVSVDAAHRTLELRQADGTVTNYNAGPEVGDFAQIKAGDRVKTTLAEERTVRFAAAGAALSDRDTNSVVHPPDGGPVMAVNTRTVTAKVVSLSYWDHKVTVQTADGKTMTVKANQYTNLALVNPGDTVSVRVSEARTFVLEKP